MNSQAIFNFKYLNLIVYYILAPRNRLHDCLKACSTEPQCRATIFHGEFNGCSLYNATLGPVSSSGDASSFIYAERTCFLSTDFVSICLYDRHLRWFSQIKEMHCNKFPVVLCLCSWRICYGSVYIKWSAVNGCITN